MQGGKAPLDPSSVEGFKEDKESVEWLNDAAIQKEVANTLKVRTFASIPLLYVTDLVPLSTALRRQREGLRRHLRQFRFSSSLVLVQLD